MLTIRKRPATIEDFLQNRKVSPWKQWRTTSKTLNFSLIFGAQATTFAKALREGGFKESECDDSIDAFELRSALNKMILEKGSVIKTKHPEWSDADVALDCKYQVCANVFRELFFKTYPGLMKRITREQTYALAHGYVRAWHGSIRHFPELKLMKRNSKGNLIGADKKLYGSMFSNLKNVAVNTTIQTLEAYQAFTLWHATMHNLRKWGFKSRIWNGTHDSIDVIIYKPETKVVLSLIRHISAMPKVPFEDMTLNMDATLADMSTPKLLEKNYYKSGTEISLTQYDDLEGALAEWNEEHGTNLEYENVVPV